MNTTYAPHIIDKLALPAIHGLKPWDVAMDAFRMHYPVPSLEVHVEPNGRTMKYRMRGFKNVEHYLQMAWLTIAMHNLPLLATRYKWKIGEVVFEDNLILTYAP